MTERIRGCLDQLQGIPGGRKLHLHHPRHERPLIMGHPLHRLSTFHVPGMTFLNALAGLRSELHLDAPHCSAQVFAPEQ